MFTSSRNFFRKFLSHFLWAGWRTLITLILITFIIVCLAVLQSVTSLHLHQRSGLHLMPLFFSSNVYRLFLCSAACHLPNHLWAGAELQLLRDGRWPWHGDERTFSGWLRLVSCSTSVIELPRWAERERKRHVLSSSWAKAPFSPVQESLRYGFIGCWVLTDADIPPLGDALRWNFLLVSQEWCFCMPVFRCGLVYLPNVCNGETHPKIKIVQWLFLVSFGSFPMAAPSFTLTSLSPWVHDWCVLCLPRGFQVTLEKGDHRVLMDTQWVTPITVNVV